jgi:hypothetical protein
VSGCSTPNDINSSSQHILTHVLHSILAYMRHELGSGGSEKPQARMAGVTGRGRAGPSNTIPCWRPSAVGGVPLQVTIGRAGTQPSDGARAEPCGRRWSVVTGAGGRCEPAVWVGAAVGLPKADASAALAAERRRAEDSPRRAGASKMSRDRPPPRVRDGCAVGEVV